jgi:hypothetical protein
MQNDADPTNVDQEAVQRRAYELYEKRGREDGHDWDDWLAAERELRGSVVAEATPAPTEVAQKNARRRRAQEPQARDGGELAQV